MTSAGFFASIIIFVVTLVLIFLERFHRTSLAIAGAVVMVGAGIAFGFYGEEEAASSIDYETLGLLLGMMLLVALLQPTGFFEYIAIRAARLSKGNPILLLILLGTVTTLLSMFLDNVTTVVLIAPVTVLICEILGINPVPYLISEALLSNTGGAGTLVGDPPNVLIGSAAPLSFNQFLTHSLPVVIVVWIVALFFLIRQFRPEMVTSPQAAERLKHLDPAKALNDPIAARKVLIVLGAAVLFFFIQNFLHISPAYVALSAGAVALLWVQPEDVPETFERIEWNVLIFFIALFVMVGGLEAAGVLEWIADILLESGQGVNPILLGVGMIWIVAVLSSIVDNIPITIALIPVIQQLGAAGININPLWWALVFGAGFGGNGTIIGSTANVVVVSLAEKARRPISTATWSKSGLPVMIIACAVASVLFAIFYPWFAR